jgi:hypothetical protein
MTRTHISLIRTKLPMIHQDGERCVGRHNGYLFLQMMCSSISDLEKGGSFFWLRIYESLTKIARENIRKNRTRLRCKNIELVTMDVLDFEIPDDMTIAYFFNPFVNELFTGVLDNIHRSLQMAPRPLWIIYLNPVMHEALSKCTWLRCAGECNKMRLYQAV